MTSNTHSTLATMIALSLVGGLALLAPAQSLGQEKQKISWSAKAENTKYTFQHTLEIADVPGHVLRLYEIRRTYPDNPPVVQGVKVVEDVTRGVTDAIEGNGRAWGYGSWRLENGDVIFFEWQNSLQSVTNPDGSKRLTFPGVFVFKGGTGKMQGIRGVARNMGFAEWAASGAATRNEYSAEGQYWIEK